MADCASPQPERVAPENRTSFGGRYCLLTCSGRTSFQTSSVLPRIAAAKRPISSWGAPCAALLLLIVAAAAAVQHLRPADQDAGIDAESPADEAEDDDGADSEAACSPRDAHAAPVLDVGGGSKVFPAHVHPRFGRKVTNKVKFGRLGSWTFGDA